MELFKSIFLIGGYDLEMVEIIKILEERGLKYFDKKLYWGAKLSEYKEFFNSANTFIGIELIEDITPPTNYINIDHHNDKSEQPSAIEQLAKMLDFKLNRWQQLVAANDKGYIPAMMAMCGTNDEINQIRRADRNAQGVTDEDEKLAEKSIVDNQTSKNGISIIKSLTSKFSPITDRMFSKTDKLLIYTDTELTYYGKDKNILVKRFGRFITSKKAYHGGDENGFFGFSTKAFSKKGIEKYKNEIIELLKTEEELHSFHVFILPFKWRHSDNNQTLRHSFDINKLKSELNNKKGWKHKEYSLDSFENYNEFNYFYSYVRSVLYDCDKELLMRKDENQLICHFEYENLKESYYNISILGNENIYRLKISSILLNFYSTGVGVLSFHLRNFNYSGKDDILAINQFGRRLYPPFYGLNDLSVITGEKDNITGIDALIKTKKSELACAIWIGEENSSPSNENKFYDNFSRYEDLENIKRTPFLLPKFIRDLFPDNFLKTSGEEGIIELNQVLDDRMFVLCWYGNNKLTRLFTKIDEPRNEYAHTCNDWWYKYLFVDSDSLTCDDIFLKKQLIKDHTYSRWVGKYGTLYGISRYSFVCLTSGVKDASFLVRHMQTMYYKMAELSLLQRATVLSYSEEIAHVSNLILENDNKDNLIIDSINDLYGHYIHFINKVFFREVTAQEQGIEMYDMLQKYMRNERDVKELDKEFDELHKYINILESKKLSEQSLRLNRIAAVFLIPTFLISLVSLSTSLYNENIPEYFFNTTWHTRFWIAIAFIFVLSILLAIPINSIFKLGLFRWLSNKNKKDKKI